MRKPRPQGTREDCGKAGLGPVDTDRREALKTVGRLAVYVSPAMTVPLPGRADAHHNPGHTKPDCSQNPRSPHCSAF